ncbi:MAG: FAD-dependent tricarballylate dehydrogenase TcuA [Alkalilacustris sp.]
MGDGLRTGVLVIGGGFAGLCAAIEARLTGAEVLLVDAAPPHLFGGNARHCRNIRLASERATPWQQGSYPADEFAADLITAGAPDPALAHLLADGAGALGPWLIAQGVALEPWADGNLPPSRRTAFFAGGGQAMTNALVRRATALGVVVRHGWRVERLAPSALDPAHAGPLAVPVVTPDGPVTVAAGAVVLASGGYGGDRARLAAALGHAAHAIANRGTPHQSGTVLWWLLETGAAAAGRSGAGHLVAVDARAAMDDAGIVSRAEGIPLGLVVGADGRRMRDEGATTGPARYSLWGRVLAARGDPRGWLILSPEAAAGLPPILYPPLHADSPATLARLCGIDAAGLTATLAAVAQGAPDPPRSPCPMPLPAPQGPLCAIPLRPGLSFTLHGVAVDEQARVRLATGAAAPRLFAAGAAMAGAVLGARYLSGSALTIGGVFGRIAGRNAAALAGRQASKTSAARPASVRAEVAVTGPMVADHGTAEPVGHGTDRPADALAAVRRALNICNTCGFCTALCAVFPAAKLRPDLAGGDIAHLAHLCHDCGSCRDDCQYAPPHAFAVDLPAMLSAVRAADYGAPIPVARAAAVQGAVFVLCLLGLPLVALLAGPQALGAGVALGIAAAAGLLAIRLTRFWRGGDGPPRRHGLRPLARAALDALTLRNMGGAGHGCEDRHGPTGALRRWSHHGLLAGLTVALVAAHVSGGGALADGLTILGGGAMLAALAGLELARRRAPPAAAAGANRLLAGQLAVVAVTGLALVAFDTAVLLPALHVGAVLGLLLGLPFGKLSHGGWRALALYRHAAERAAKGPPRRLSIPLDKPQGRRA